MKLRSPRQRGFTIPELSVVMFLTVIITAVLVMFYAQSKLKLQRGVARTELQQRTRTTAIRIIPKIASSIQLPPNAEHPTYPDGLPPIAWPLRADEETPVIVLNTTNEFIQTQMRVDPITDIFNPRWDGTGASPYGLLRLKFVLLPAPDDVRVVGQDGYGNDIRVTVGEVRMDVYDGPAIPAPTDPGFAAFGVDPNDLLVGDDLDDDIVIASNVSDVTFKVDGDNRRITMRVVALGTMPNATSGDSIASQVYETEVFLPVFTNSGG
jgi:prepilin-type N-terminal cleavage/methylation domain-containing protein